MAIIGSARHDENGKISGGSAGDQTTKEVSTQNYYNHSKGWIVLRAFDPIVASKIADDMQAACDNPNIGYDQGQRNTLYNVAVAVGFDCAKVRVKCETDCSALVRVCWLYAGVTVGDFNTSSEAAALLATGAFSKITSFNEGDLRRGDILVTKTKGHTAIVIQAQAQTQTSKKNIIADGQKYANKVTGWAINIDGVRGQETRKAAAAVLQVCLNLDYSSGLVVDGIFGKKSRLALGAHYIKRGERQYMVTAAEVLYMLQGIDPGGVEFPGVFGSGLTRASGDGMIDANDFLKLIS